MTKADRSLLRGACAGFERLQGVGGALLYPMVFAALLFGAVAAAEVVDRIVAVVGDYLILKSEVDFQAQIWAMQNKQEQTAEQMDAIKKELVEQMVNDKLILIEALRDTSIQVSAEEVEEVLDSKLSELRGRFPSQAEFERQMALEGLSYRELKNKFREEMKNQLYKDRLISRELGQISVSLPEIEEFFSKYKDSLPPHPEAVKLAHILLKVEPGSDVLDSALERAERVEALLAEGRDFAELATEYSEDASAESGGDLGYFGHGDMVHEFEEAAFALNPGEVSDIVRSQFGYHIIKCEAKDQDRVRCRHILFLSTPAESDKARVIALADSLRTAAESGSDFAELVKQFSVDEETKIKGGELDWFMVSELTPEFKQAVSGLKPGELSQPTESQFGIHVIKLIDRQVSRPWSIEDDRDRLRELAKRQKTEVVVAKLLAELKEDIYFEVRNQ
jgi:peptidyl-prolyl cis-trans isomerase SurA